MFTRYTHLYNNHIYFHKQKELIPTTNFRKMQILLLRK